MPLIWWGDNYYNHCCAAAVATDSREGSATEGDGSSSENEKSEMIIIKPLNSLSISSNVSHCYS